MSGLARAPGFLIPLLIATVFGAGPSTDSYFLVYSAVLLIGGTLGQGLEVSVVPFAARARQSAASQLRGYLGRAAVAAAMVAGVCWLVAVSLLLASGAHTLDGDIFRYAAAFMPMVVLWCAASVYSGTLISQWDIAYSASSMLWRGVGALIGLGLAPTGAGLGAVAVGLGVGELCRLWWLHRRVVIRLPATVATNMLPLAPLRRAATAQVLAGVAGSIVPVVERMLAGGLGPGAISHLEYASRLLTIPALAFDGALAPLLLARWSNQLGSSGSSPTFADVLRPVGKGVALAAGCAVSLAVFAPQVVFFLLRHGRFSDADASIVAQLLRVLSAGFVASMGALLLERFYLAGSRNRTLAMLSLARAGTRITVAVALLGSLRLLAFGIGFAVAEWVYCVLLILIMAYGKWSSRSGITV